MYLKYSWEVPCIILKVYTMEGFVGSQSLTASQRSRESEIMFSPQSSQKTTRKVSFVMNGSLRLCPHTENPFKSSSVPPSSIWCSNLCYSLPAWPHPQSCSCSDMISLFLQDLGTGLFLCLSVTPHILTGFPVLAPYISAQAASLAELPLLHDSLTPCHAAWLLFRALTNNISLKT